jgi:hypothetical protein
MLLFDVGPPPEILIGIGIGVIIFFLLVFAAIAFVAYKLLKHKK